MKRSMLIGLFLLAFCGQPLGQADIVGMGNQDCRSFANDQSQDNQVFNWSVGFMSGINMVLFAEGRETVDVSAVSWVMLNELRNICAKQPSLNISGALLEFFNDLPKMPPRSEPVRSP